MKFIMQAIMHEKYENYAIYYDDYYGNTIVKNLPTTMDRIFEKMSSFHVKQRTTGKF